MCDIIDWLVQNMNFVGLLLQFIGVTVILISQAFFWYRTRKKFGSLKKAFVDFSAGRFGVDDKELEKADKNETDRLLRKFPLGQYLWDDLKISVFGLVLTLIGISFEMLA